MDSSSDFGPVGRGFMVFHFCKKRGCLKIFKFFGEYIFSGWFRAKNAKGGEGDKEDAGMVLLLLGEKAGMREGVQSVR